MVRHRGYKWERSSPILDDLLAQLMAKHPDLDAVAILTAAMVELSRRG